MKKSALKVGNWYKINYRTTLAKNKGTSYGGYSYEYGYKEKPQAGVGVLLKISAKAGQHQFELDSGEKVYATSQGVLNEVSASVAGKGGMLTAELQNQLEKLRKMGLDDESRANEINMTRTLLYDLGVICKADDDNTHVTIDYMSLINLKFLALTLLKKSMEIEDDTADLLN